MSPAITSSSASTSDRRRSRPSWSIRTPAPWRGPSTGVTKRGWPNAAGAARGDRRRVRRHPARSHPHLRHRLRRWSAVRPAGREVRAGSERRHDGGRRAAPRRGERRRTWRAGREDHHVRDGRVRREARHRLDERQVRVRHRRDDRQVSDQGRHLARRDSGSALGSVAAASRRRQVRRLRRDRHRQPGEGRHPVERDHVLARRCDRVAEPVGPDAREHAEAEGPAARRTEHLPAVPARLLAPADSRNLARSRFCRTRPTCPSISSSRAAERRVLRGVRRGALRPARAASAGQLPRPGSAEGLRRGRTDRAARGVRRSGPCGRAWRSSTTSAARMRFRRSCPRPSSRARTCAP